MVTTSQKVVLGRCLESRVGATVWDDALTTCNRRRGGACLLSRSYSPEDDSSEDESSGVGFLDRLFFLCFDLVGFGLSGTAEDVEDGDDVGFDDEL